MEAMKTVYEFIDKAKVYYLATTDEGGQPRVRVYGTILLFEDKLYVMAFSRSNADRQLNANPKAEICCYDGKQLRLTCELAEDDRQEVKQAMLEKMPSLKSVVGDDMSGGVMYQVTHAHATIADMAGNSREYDF